MHEDERCPLCGRPLPPTGRVDRHHVVPKSRGGRVTVRMHRICHRKLHSLFTEAELARFGDDFAALRRDPDIARFLRWLEGKPPDFWAPTMEARRKRGRRR